MEETSGRATEEKSFSQDGQARNRFQVRRGDRQYVHNNGGGDDMNSPLDPGFG